MSLFRNKTSHYKEFFQEDLFRLVFKQSPDTKKIKVVTKIYVSWMHALRSLLRFMDGRDQTVWAVCLKRKGGLPIYSTLLHSNCDDI